MSGRFASKMPGKKTSSDSDDNEGDSQADSEIELQKLQRQYRLLEGERKAAHREAVETMNKQKSEIEALEKEKEELDLTMKSLKSSTQQRKQRKHYEELKLLTLKNSELQKAIEKEKKKQEEFDEKIREETEKLARVEEVRQASKESIKKNLASQKKIKKLDDQLQLANGRFCKLLKDNKDLRTEIESLRTQRRRLDGLLERVDRERRDLRAETAEVIEGSTRAHEERNEAQEKLAQLREKSEREELRFDADMKQLKRNIDESKKLLNFLATVGKDREEDEEMRRLRERKEAVLLERRKILQVDTLETYEDAWKRIRAVTQEEDVDTIISRFLEVEEENFAVFKFVNNQSTTIEQLQEEIDIIRKKISDFEDCHKNRRDQKSLMQKTFEERRAELQQITSAYEEKYVKIVRLLEKIREKIHSIFKVIKCDSGDFDFGSLGFDEGITDRNCLRYLALIEGKTDEMILERSLGGCKLPERDEELLSSTNPVGTFREERDSSQGDDDIIIALPSMKFERSVAALRGFVPSETTPGKTTSTLTSIEAVVPLGLDEIRKSTMVSVLTNEQLSSEGLQCSQR